ncbi:AbiV family abortive infection protein [Weissella paramesenteroides]|uniref:AbiV family abortive infection protein n=1 Tax=Weissella paramesenteroides TaxID=1249 RepID=UPI00103B48E2|nr:AbiV family abortive infection protein [Weissella paramesenteroides]RZQ57450.1 AbiV family abortive infection protein [Weissella paramesenteroides]
MSIDNRTHFNIPDTTNFNSAIDHIIELLNNSFVLLQNNSYGSSAFFAITALEETAKTHFSIYMTHDLSMKNSKDILMKHAQKHSLAISPVFKIGHRLSNALGIEKVDELVSRTNLNNGLMDLRNNAIYWYTDKDGTHFPKDYFDKDMALELLLFSIEAFDDSLVGYTEYSITASHMTDDLFKLAEQQYAKNNNLFHNS